MKYNELIDACEACGYYCDECQLKRECDAVSKSLSELRPNHVAEYVTGKCDVDCLIKRYIG